MKSRRSDECCESLKALAVRTKSEIMTDFKHSVPSQIFRFTPHPSVLSECFFVHFFTFCAPFFLFCTVYSNDNDNDNLIVMSTKLMIFQLFTFINDSAVVIMLIRLSKDSRSSLKDSCPVSTRQLLISVLRDTLRIHPHVMRDKKRIEFMADSKFSV